MTIARPRDGVDRLVVVSNRLPVVLSRTADNSWDVQRGSGGLVSALAPVLRDRGGTWIGWPGSSYSEDLAQALDDVSDDFGYRLVGVPLNDQQIAGYYHGFSNEVIWPLFHDVPSRCNFDPVNWRHYRDANAAFADVVAAQTRSSDWIWVHDYQLLLVAEQLRAANVARRTGFFLHIPFPAVDLFLKLPWRFEILRGLLEYELIGFQTTRDVRNFIGCVRGLLPGAKVRRHERAYAIQVGDREVQAGSFPIGIDFGYYDGHARDERVQALARNVHEQLPNLKIVLGIDRLDYTKGLPERLIAFRNALRRYPDLVGGVTLTQVVVPSREHVPEYQALKSEVEQLVGEITGEFSQPGWVPIHYLYRSLAPDELIAYYLAAEICLVTPLKDGMNLVSKEYCAANIDIDGVLILSEFAGAAAQFQRGALLVNPHDTEGMADAIYAAFRMGLAERRTRMRRLRTVVERSDIFRWTESFLQAAISKELDAFPIHDYYVPQGELREVALSE